MYPYSLSYHTYNTILFLSGEIIVYNLMGQMVLSLLVNESKGANKHEINVSDLTFGLYLVVVKMEIQTLNAKFIKE